MKDNYKNTFNKININEHKKNEMRNNLKELQVSKGKKVPVWMKVSVAAAMMVAVLMCIPTTRTIAANALKYVTGVFKFSDGSQVSVVQNDTKDEVSVAVTMDVDEQGYVEVVDERIYFVHNNSKMDVTDFCSETKYYQYEEIDENGYKHMIFVGGTFEYAGWVELLFDSEGKYITNRMSVPGDCDTWVELAMDSAGVPTGNPELDKEFLE